MDNQKTFAKGINFKRNDNAPEFVVGKLAIKTDEAVAFLNETSKNGWVNLDIKKAKSGKYYIELDTYEVKAKTTEDLGPGKYKSAQEFDEGLPF
jgi:hypothetical protein